MLCDRSSNRPCEATEDRTKVTVGYAVELNSTGQGAPDVFCGWCQCSKCLTVCMLLANDQPCMTQEAVLSATCIGTDGPTSLEWSGNMA